MNGIYYGAGRNVIGPYQPNEVKGRASARRIMRQSGRQVYEIQATSYEDALRKLLRQVR